MPTLNIGGKRVKVGDDFMSLSPEDQNATVEEIAGSFAPDTWSETFAKAKENAPNPIKDPTGYLKGQFSNPIEDVKNVGKLVLGGAEHALGFEPHQQISNEQEVASNFAKHYGNYFSEKGIKENISQNPAATLTDVLSFGFPAARGAAGIGRRIVTPNPARPGYAGATATLEGEGVPQTAGQRTGARTLKYAESELGGRRTSTILDEQGEAFTRAASTRIGENAPHLTGDVLNNARHRIGNDFDTVGLRNNIPRDPQLDIDLQRAVQEYTHSVPQAAPGVGNIAQGIANRPLTGQQYNMFRSRLSRLARNTSDPQLKTAYTDMRNALDDALERSLQASGNQADLDVFATARQQWRNLMVLENAMTRGSQAGRGILTPAQLESAASSGPNRSWYSRGLSDFSDLAKAGRVGMEGMPESGTSARVMINTVPAAIGGVIGGGGAGALGAAAGAIGGRLVAGRALMSAPVQGYLGNQLMPPRPPAPGAAAAGRVAPAVAVGTNREQTYSQTEAVLSPEVLAQVKKFAPRELNAWIGTRSPDAAAALAKVIAEKANRPDLVERIIGELTAQ
jgi:hypothetical protein